MQFKISAPLPPPAASSPPTGRTPSSPQLTNSLVLTGLPPVFFHALVLDALRDHFEAYGSLYAWAPIKSFSRVIMVYYKEEHAENAKLGSDGIIIERTSMRFALSCKFSCMQESDHSTLKSRSRSACFSRRSNTHLSIINFFQTLHLTLSPQTAGPGKEFPHFSSRFPACRVGTNRRGASE